MNRHCYPNMQNCDYYVISHHGSINGHLRSLCLKHRPVQKVSDCLKQRIQTIMMGRTNAYRGIPSSQVLRDFGDIIYSEKEQSGSESKFVELELDKRTVAWHL